MEPEILTLPPIEPEQELNEEQYEFKMKREKAQKCRVIALDRINLHPITTIIGQLNKSAQKAVMKDIEDLFEKPIEEVDGLFNEIMCHLLDTDDYTTYPVYKRSIPIPIG
jgi:hypothetical protein